MEVSPLRAQVPALCLHNSMSLHSFHLKSAAVGGFGLGFLEMGITPINNGTLLGPGRGLRDVWT